MLTTASSNLSTFVRVLLKDTEPEGTALQSVSTTVAAREVSSRLVPVCPAGAQSVLRSYF